MQTEVPRRLGCDGEGGGLQQGLNLWTKNLPESHLLWGQRRQGWRGRRSCGRQGLLRSRGGDDDSRGLWPGAVGAAEGVRDHVLLTWDMPNIGCEFGDEGQLSLLPGGPWLASLT